MKNFIALFVYLFALIACSDSNYQTSNICQLESSYTVEFLGHAFGKGHITFLREDDNQNYTYEISVVSPGKPTPDIAIKGLAQCDKGIVSGKFGGGTANKPQLNVLGGRFEGVFNHSSIDSPFGRWEIALFDAEKEKHYNLSGYWQERALTTVAATP